MNDAPAVSAPAPGDFRFSAGFEFAAPADAEKGPRRITGVAYSGELLSHMYWDAVIFDLSTTTAPARMPVLVDHDRSKRAGVAQMRVTPDRIEIAEGFLLPNDTGAQVAADADAGFPWQLSVHIEPREIQRLSAGETAVVNGRTVAGPATVFRNSTLREVSFTPTGVDANTSATVFSRPAHAHEGTPKMTNPNPATAEQAAADLATAQAAATSAQASLEAANAQTESLRAELATSRAEVASIRGETRMSAVRALFSDLGREFTDAAAAPYVAMEETAFAAVAGDMRAAKPKAAPSLFSHQATTGTDGAAVDPHQFAAAIRAEQNKAAQNGETVSVLEAARRVREASGTGNGAA